MGPNNADDLHRGYVYLTKWIFRVSLLYLFAEEILGADHTAAVVGKTREFYPTNVSSRNNCGGNRASIHQCRPSFNKLNSTLCISNHENARPRSRFQQVKEFQSQISASLVGARTKMDMNMGTSTSSMNGTSMVRPTIVACIHY